MKSWKTKIFDGFANFAAKIGYGTNSLTTQGTYILTLLTRDRLKLEAMYRGSWIVGAAIDAIAEDMTRSGIDIVSSDDPEKIQKIQREMMRLGIWTQLRNAIKWGRLYGGSIATIVIAGQDPSTELEIDTVSYNQFRGLRVYDRWSLQPSVSDIVQDG